MVEHRFFFTHVDTAVNEKNQVECKEIMQRLLAKRRAAAANAAVAAVKNANDGTEIPSPAVSRPSTPVSLLTPAEQRRSMLLFKNPSLKALYDDLVTTGSLTSSEFWETRKDLLKEDEESIKQQSMGVLSELVSDARSGLTSGESGFITGEARVKIKYRLTEDMIHSIFTMYPSVKAHYDARLANIPVNDSAARNKIMLDFWEQYFDTQQSMQYHTARLEKAVKDGNVFAASINNEQLSYKKRVNGGGDAVTSALIDVGGKDSLSYLESEGYGVSSLKRPLPETGPEYLRVQRFNRHSAMVLDTLRKEGMDAADTNATVSSESCSHRDILRSAIQYDDLISQTEPKYHELRLKNGINCGKYSITESPPPLVDYEDSYRQSLRRRLNNWTGNLSSCINSGDNNIAINEAVTQRLSKSIVSSKHTGSALDTSQETEASAILQVRLYSTAIFELLGHFWTALRQFVATINPQAMLKKRLLDLNLELQQRKMRIIKFRDSLSGTAKQIVEMTVERCLRSIDIASGKFERINSTTRARAPVRRQ